MKARRQFYAKNIILFMLVMLAQNLMAQSFIGISPIEEKHNSINLGASYGEFIQRESRFYGFSVDYSRKIKHLPIGIGTSVMWVKEVPYKAGENIVQSFTLAATASWIIYKSFSIGTGLGKGFINDDNPSYKYKISNGDLGTGIFGGYQFSLKDIGSVSLSTSYEYNISQNENSISIDFSFGKAF